MCTGSARSQSQAPRSPIQAAQARHEMRVPGLAGSCPTNGRQNGPGTANAAGTTVLATVVAFPGLSAARGSRCGTPPHTGPSPPAAHHRRRCSSLERESGLNVAVRDCDVGREAFRRQPTRDVGGGVRHRHGQRHAVSFNKTPEPSLPSGTRPGLRSFGWSARVADAGRVPLSTTRR